LQGGLPETGLHSTDARFVSYQDTILDDRGLHYYSDCYVEGATDFILSPGKAFFEVINSLICCT
jgi:pectin methylesterase-like acyl-CoA thioesterase